VVYAARDLSPADRDRLRLGETRFFTKGRVPPDRLAETVHELLARPAANEPGS
jgi:hypothetical protein